VTASLRFVIAAAAILMSGQARAETVLLHAAGSLRDALEETARAFEAASGVAVKTRYGASGLLKDEILDGAEAEVFASANLARHGFAAPTLPDAP
jgi:ABC-type molybdate transport system substrate-binding protein